MSDPLYERIQLPMLLRVVLFAFLGLLFIGYGIGAKDLHEPIKNLSLVYLALPIAYFLLVSIGYGLSFRRVRNLRTFSFAQLVLDTMFVTYLVFLTGGIESILPFLYILVIIVAATLHYRTGAMIVASLSSVFYVSLLLCEWADLVSPPFTMAAESGIHAPEDYVTRIFVMVAAFFAVAFLMSTLAERLKKTGEQLLESETHLQDLETFNKDIIENMSSGLLTVDTGGRVASFNRTAEVITGRRSGDVLGKPLSVLFPSIDRLDPDALEQAVHARFVPRFQTGCERPDGSRRHLGFSFSTLRDHEDHEKGKIVIFQDLTELKYLEAQMKRADKLAAIGQLAGGLAHEIRNPLGSISGSIEMLNSSLNLSKENKNLMEIVLREVERLNQLITDFLVFARPTSDRVERTDLTSLVQETAAMLKQSRFSRPEVEVEVEAPGTMKIECDPQQIRQVIWNLVLNAYSAIPEDGRIAITVQKKRAHRADAPKARVPESRLKSWGNSPSDRDYVEIRVEDTGVGIDSEHIENIFDPFYTTKEEGTGLGLAMVYRIVESHGGYIQVESRKGCGTAFVVNLPRCYPRQEPADSKVSWAGHERKAVCGR